MNASHDQWRPLPVPDRWCVHSYYTLCPYSPDGSGRLLVGGANLDRNRAEVIVLSPTGQVLDRFGDVPPTGSFWHTGLWQCWGPDARFVYYQCGSLREPRMARRELATGREVIVDGDMEGLPPSGEPGISCSHGMLYAAGYGDGRYKPDEAPVPFQSRDRHGISQMTFDPPAEKLVLSTADILARHPQRDRLLEADRQVRHRLGAGEGLTLMTYCVRWSPAGDRFLFYFGNHCVVTERGEPRLSYVFTADRALSDIHLAVDLSFGKRGVHWGWHPDGEHLIGYGPDPSGEGMCLAQVRYDGSDYRRISAHRSGGHPSICPADHRMLVTDVSSIPGKVEFIDLRTDRIVAAHHLPRTRTQTEPPGRNPDRVCHHPVFDRAGAKVLINTMADRFATLCELPVPKLAD